MLQLDKEQEAQFGLELATKRQEHADLDAAIHTLTQSQFADRMLVQRLKKRKLALKDRIVQLEEFPHSRYYRLTLLALKRQYASVSCVGMSLPRNR
ncbi:YdcH family protein [Devosia riboflavina]